MIGKTIQLEFKVRKEKIEDTEKEEIRKEAEETLALIEQRIEKLRANISQHEKKLEWYERHSYLPLAISAKATIQHQKVEIQTAQDFIALLKREPDYYKQLGQTLLHCMNQEESQK